MSAPTKPDSAEKAIYWTSFLIRCAFGLAAWWISQYTSVTLVEDAALYESIGSRIALEWMMEGESRTLALLMNLERQAWVIYFILAVFSFLLGGQRALPIIIILFNLITAWVPVYTHRTAILLGVSRSGALRAARIVMFSPVFAFWAGALYKEGLVLLALSVIVYHILVLQKSFRVRSLFILATALIALLGLRFYLAALVAPTILLGLFLGRSRNRSEKADPGVLFMRQGVIIATLLVGFSVLGITSRIRQVLPNDTFDLLQQIQKSRNDLSNASSGYFRGADVSNPGVAVRFLPTGILYFLTVPFPWQLGSLRQTLVIPEMIFWLVQYPLIFIGMRTGLRRNFQGSTLLLTMTIVMLVFYGLFVGNVGTAYRMRAQIWLFWALFAGWHKDGKILERRQRLASPA